VRIKKKIAFVLGAAALITVAVVGSDSEQVKTHDLVADPGLAGVQAPPNQGAAPQESTGVPKIERVAPGGMGNDRNGNGQNKNETGAGEKATEGGKRPVDLKYGPVTDNLIAHTPHTSGKHVALTFDDGPDPVWTPQVLKLLRQHHAKATFCVLGERAVAYPELIRQIVADGHTLCDHTMTHDANLPGNARAVQLAEIDGALKAIHQAVPGAPVPYYRAPEGTFSQDVQTLAASLGMRSVAWSIDTRDWTRPGAPAIVESVRSVIGTDDVVLMHDGGGNRSQTVQALADLLPWLVAQGYQFELPS
jgi:peptidoglycan/xylan/chitin deacetylase (PgdA/CDA1 family)